MKLRLKGDTIRLRLTQSEVVAVANGDTVVETTCLPQPFSYALETSGDEKGDGKGDGKGDRIAAAFADGRMTVTIPAAVATHWAGTEQVSLRGREGAVEILVEKDFACLTPREGEDDPDAFPNPLSEHTATPGTERP